MVTGSHKIAGEIADALGIKHCVSLSISMSLDSMVIVTARYYPDEESMRKMLPILKKYVLTDPPEEKGETNENLCP